MNQGFGTPGGADTYKISGFELISKKTKQIPFQGDHSKFEFLECCLKNADDPPGGGGFAPPWEILAFSRNREIRISSDRLGKGFFFDFLEICSKPEILYLSV